MNQSWELELALQGLNDFRRDLSKTPAEKLDLLEQERRVQQVVHALGCELMREVFMRADVKEPEVVVNGQRWGNRRESEAPFVSTLKRVPKSIAARYETQREEVNAELRATEQVPDEAVTVQVSLDGVMVPQDGEHAKPRGRETSCPKAPRHETRYGPVNSKVQPMTMA